MREVTREFPDDLDAQVLLAEAIMDTMPWDYWTRDRKPKPETEEALAARQNPVDAAREHAALARLAGSDEAKKLDSPQFPASAILAVTDYWLAGKVAAAQGDSAGAIAQLKKAVAAADALPYMEPGYWPLPVRPTLGAALLSSGDAAGAEQVFREDLNHWPRNGWALCGLEASLRRQGKTQSADLMQRELEAAWKRADTTLDLRWF